MRKLLIGVIALLSLAACGDRSSGAGDNGGDEWTVVTDPYTRRTFHCFTIWRSASHKGGPAMWCYEP